MTPKPLPPVTTGPEPHCLNQNPLVFAFPVFVATLVTLLAAEITNPTTLILAPLALAATLAFLLQRLAKSHKGPEISWDENQIWKRKKPQTPALWILPWSELEKISLFDSTLTLNPQKGTRLKIKLPNHQGRTILIASIGRRLVDTSETEEARPFSPQFSQRIHLLAATLGILLSFAIAALSKHPSIPSVVTIVAGFVGFVALMTCLQYATAAYKARKYAPLANLDRELDDLFYDRYGEDAPHIARFYRHTWAHSSFPFINDLPNWKPDSTHTSKPTPKQDKIKTQR